MHMVKHKTCLNFQHRRQETSEVAGTSMLLKESILQLGKHSDCSSMKNTREDSGKKRKGKKPKIQTKSKNGLISACKLAHRDQAQSGI